MPTDHVPKFKKFDGLIFTRHFSYRTRENAEATVTEVHRRGEKARIFPNIQHGQQRYTVYIRRKK